MRSNEGWSRRVAIRQAARELVWAAREVLRWSPAAAIGLLGVQVLAGLGPAASVLITQHVINLAISFAGRGAGSFGRMVPWLAALAVALILSRGPVAQLRGPLDQRIVQHLEYGLERARMAKAARLPLLFFELSENYDRLSRSAASGAKVHRAVRAGLDLLQGLISVVTTALLFRAVAIWLPLALVAAVVPLALRSAEVNRQWMAFTYGQTEDERRLRYVDGLLTGRHQQKEVRVFRLHATLTDRWHGLRRALRGKMLGQKRGQVLQTLPTTALTLLVIIGAAFLLAAALAAHRITTGAFVALFGGVGAMLVAMQHVAFGMRDLQTGATDVGYVRQFLALPEAEGGGRRAGGRFPEPLRDGIRLEGVSFAYPGRAEPILERLDLHLRAGECVALVGENGSGKSTLANLLLGLYQPVEGRITADGVDYRDIAVEALHDGVSAVYQDYYNFCFTARESVGVGRVSALDDLEAVRAAARLGGADGFISTLAHGYETPLGHVLDGGTGLSQGQWQRIATSRAFMRTPQLLILDEPTASLDPRAEAEVYRRLTELLAGRSGGGETGAPPLQHRACACLLISHRLGAARLAERILVLHGGRIAEDGTHEQLLALGGQYARMWEEQAQWYR